MSPSTSPPPINNGGSRDEPCPKKAKTEIGENGSNHQHRERNVEDRKGQDHGGEGYRHPQQQEIEQQRLVHRQLNDLDSEVINLDDEEINSDEEILQRILAAAVSQGIPIEYLAAQGFNFNFGDDDTPVDYPFDNPPTSLDDIANFIRSEKCKKILVLAG